MTQASQYRCARCASVYAIPYVQEGHYAPLTCHAVYLDTAQQPRTCGGDLEPFTPVPASREAPHA
jgi:hypothetical protein